MNGKAVRTFVCMGRTANAHFEGYFYNDWHIIEDVDMGEKSLGKVILKPACFDGMLSVAETLTVPFNHARVDLYIWRMGLIVGEIAFTLGSGFNRFHSHEFDRWLGRKLILRKPNT